VAVLTLGELKRHLGAKASDDEADLTALIDAAEAAVAQRCGPLVSTSTTKRVRGGGRALVLPVTPVVSVTSVTGKSGSLVDAGSYFVWGDSGVVTATAGFAEEFYDVVYAAGRATCPADLLLGVKEMARYMWLSRRGPAAGIAGSDTAVSALRRAEEFMAPYTRPGFA
jgi:hypothetical protein